MQIEIILSRGKRRLLVIPETEVEALILKDFNGVTTSSVTKTSLFNKIIENALILETDEKAIVTITARDNDPK